MSYPGHKEKNAYFAFLFLKYFFNSSTSNFNNFSNSSFLNLINISINATSVVNSTPNMLVEIKSYSSGVIVFITAASINGI